MTSGRFQNRVCAIVLSALCAGTVLMNISCSSNESRIKKLLQESLKPHGATDVTVDLFYTEPGLPDKAYTSATVTYSFATAEGKAQREYLGFLLAREGDGWRLERNVSYTKEPKQAAIYLAGGK